MLTQGDNIMANGNGFMGERDANGNLTVQEINAKADVPSWLRAHIHHENLPEVRAQRERDARIKAEQEKAYRIQQDKWEAALKEFEKLPLETRKALYDLLGDNPEVTISKEMMKKLGLE